MSTSLVHAAITGEYEAPADITQTGADCLVGQAFGFRVDNETGLSLPGPINESLGLIAVNTAQQLDVPTIMQGEIDDAMRSLGHPASKRIYAHRTSGQYLDTKEVLLQARQYMEEAGLTSALILAQAYHVGRVAAQAAKIGIKNRPHPNLPTAFDPESAQRWTKNRTLWIPREIAYIGFLKITSQI